MSEKREPWAKLLCSFPDSDRINSVSMGAECMYVRLLARSDDGGNYHGGAFLLLSGLFARRAEDGGVSIEDCLRWYEELAHAGLLVKYSHGQRSYVHLVNVKKTLRPDRKRDWRFPPCPQALLGPNDTSLQPIDNQLTTNCPPNDNHVAVLGAGAGAGAGAAPPTPSGEGVVAAAEKPDCPNGTQPAMNGSQFAEAPPTAIVPSRPRLTPEATAKRHLDAVVQAHNQTAKRAIPAPDELEIRGKLLDRGVTLARILAVTVPELGAAVACHSQRIRDAQAKSPGSKIPGWGLGYLRSVIFDSDNAARQADSRREAQEAKRNALATELAARMLAQKQSDTLHQQWLALPAEERQKWVSMFRGAKAEAAGEGMWIKAQKAKGQP